MNGKILIGLMIVLVFSLILFSGCINSTNDCEIAGGKWIDGKCVKQNAENDSQGIPMPNAEGIEESIPNLPI